MSRIIERLMAEHRRIEDALDALDAAATTAVREPPERALLADFVRFFQRYADAFHHGKEEDLLFVRMGDFGFPHDQGPIAVMLQEHEYGRTQVRGIEELSRGDGSLSEEEARRFVQHARAFSGMLRDHIQKEDNILYVMAEQHLPARALEALSEAGDRRDAEFGLDEARELERLCDELRRRTGLPVG